jgi:DNA polymerase elongation subunit (family B)
MNKDFEEALSVKTGEPKILTLDIETSPNVIDAWRLFDVSASLTQVREVSRVLCFGAKWYGKKSVEFYSEWDSSHGDMVEQAWRLLNETDILVTYNGPRFDVKHLQREFVLAGLGPPSPFKNVDLLQTARSQFRFASNKLDHVAQQLGLGAKLKHDGHALWTLVLDGDSKAQGRMQKYCVQDVKLTEALYDRLGPWIKNHPHFGLWTGEEKSCFACGSTKLKQHGFTRTSLTVYALLQCDDCGAWSRLNHRKGNVVSRGAS